MSSKTYRDILINWNSKQIGTVFNNHWSDQNCPLILSSHIHEQSHKVQFDMHKEQISKNNKKKKLKSRGRVSKARNGVAVSKTDEEKYLRYFERKIRSYAPRLPQADRGTPHRTSTSSPHQTILHHHAQNQPFSTETINYACDWRRFWRYRRRPPVFAETGALLLRRRMDSSPTGPDAISRERISTIEA